MFDVPQTIQPRLPDAFLHITNKLVALGLAIAGWSYSCT